MVQLSYFQEKDYQRLINWIPTEAFLIQWSGSQFSYPLTEEQIKNYCEGANTASATTYIYNVHSKTNGEVIGHISLGRVNRRNRSARIGKVFIAPEYRGLGLSTYLINAILEIAFAELALHRIELGVFDFNKRAIAVYEKAGFKKEGLKRECQFVGQEFWSLWEMAILEQEWQEKRRNK
ncbi:GNAT family N-acetyltransferase [Alkalihalobacillus sp. 1P02AB]|uniref:GNAT family N-acetyltransferase n=1 Tax=Alkalihalobacillus sp. 1P02AB TaxID=3132260 RepID=UPI0039A6A19C